jgi:hypothetical protein
MRADLRAVFKCPAAQFARVNPRFKLGVRNAEDIFHCARAHIHDQLQAFPRQGN